MEVMHQIIQHVQQIHLVVNAQFLLMHSNFQIPWLQFHHKQTYNLQNMLQTGETCKMTRVNEQEIANIMFNQMQQ